MKPDIILTPLRDLSTGPILAQSTGMSFARRIGCTLCSCPEWTSSSHAKFDLADHFSYHRIAQGPSEQSAISPPSIQSP
jgi:hypothetical protein